MVLRADGRLPIIIIGGFLGAGKTTWLRHQLHLGRFDRSHLIVNEAADTPVDGLLLANADSLETLCGCACCDGREALRQSLLALLNRKDGSDKPLFDSIVLETSGLADPAAIASAIAADPVLGRRLVVDRTIVLCDAIGGLSQLESEPLARRQAEAADDFIITKPQSADLPALSTLHASLKRLSLDARVQFCEFGEPVEIEVDELATPLTLKELDDEPNPMQAFRIDATGADWSSVSVWLSAVIGARGDDIVRIKGVIETPVGKLLLQAVRKHMQPPARLLNADDRVAASNFLILIGRNIDARRLAASWDRLVLQKCSE